LYGLIHARHLLMSRNIPDGRQGLSGVPVEAMVMRHYARCCYGRSSKHQQTDEFPANLLAVALIHQLKRRQR
ncbi:hypothetical protein PFISCL1PPCAC_8587, partial [Pristionchus fissidentatus]